MKKEIIDKYKIHMMRALEKESNQEHYDILCKIIEQLCRLRITAND